MISMKKSLNLFLLGVILATSLNVFSVQPIFAGDGCNYLTKVATNFFEQREVETRYGDFVAKLRAGTATEADWDKQLIKIHNDETLNKLTEKLGYEDPVAKIKNPKKALATAALQKQWGAYAWKVYWSNWRENPTYYRFHEILSVLKKKGLNHPVEIYGKEGYKSWRESLRYLEDIRQKEFRLSDDLTSTVNKMIIMAEVHWSEKFNWILGPISNGGLVFKGGGRFKGKYDSNYGRQNRGYPEFITEKVYQKLIANKSLGSTPFVEVEIKGTELPEDVRFGYMNYADYDKSREMLKELNDWANEEMDKIDAKDSEAMDPISLAVEYQFKFVSIHPFLDGNGRTSKLLMDRILMRFDLAPPTFKEDDWDVYYSLQEYIVKVREAIYRSTGLYSTAYRRRQKDGGVWLREAPWPGKTNKKDTPVTRISDLELPADLTKLRNKYMSKDQLLEPQNKTIQINIGKNHFSNWLVLQDDGFFYNNKGIPHAYYEGKMYPISFKSYLLYGRMGKQMENDGLRRDHNEVHKAMYIRNLELIKALEAGAVQADQIELQRYIEIKEANNLNKLMLRPFEEALFEKVVNIDVSLEKLKALPEKLKGVTDPEEIGRILMPAYYTLVSTRGGNTALERAFMKGQKTSVPIVLAQYLWADFEFWEYLQYAKKNRKDLKKIIKQSRKKLHAAGRAMMLAFYAQRDSLPKATRKFVDSQSEMILFDEFINHSLLSSKRYPILNWGDDKQLLLRADYVWANVAGFMDESTYRDYMRSDGDSILKWIARKDYKRLHKELSGDEFIRFLRELHAKWNDLKYDYVEKMGKRKQGERQMKKTLMLKEVLADNPALFGQFEGLSKKFMKIMTEGALKLPFTEKRIIKPLDIDYFLANAVELLESPFEHRGTLEEYESIFINMILHMTDRRSNKLGTSWSVLTPLYVKKNGNEHFPFVNKSMYPRLFVVKVPKDALIANRWNTYLPQEEFVHVGRFDPDWKPFIRAIKKSYTEDLLVRPTVKNIMEPLLSKGLKSIKVKKAVRKLLLEDMLENGMKNVEKILTDNKVQNVADVAEVLRTMYKPLKEEADKVVKDTKEFMKKYYTIYTPKQRD